jgi:hypothetical protein
VPRMRLKLACVDRRWPCWFGVMTGCTTVPETGRSQFNLLTPTDEMKLGVTAFDQMKGETPISKDPAANQMVQEVGKRIAAVAELPNAQWEFVVFESEQANAFCLPGGKVGVYTGILPITKTRRAGHGDRARGGACGGAAWRRTGEHFGGLAGVGGVASELSNRAVGPAGEAGGGERLWVGRDGGGRIAIQPQAGVGGRLHRIACTWPGPATIRRRR